MARGYRDMVDEAEARVATLAATDAVGLVDDEDVLFVDVRDRRELEREGRVPGAFHCPRGMLEFWIDPDSPYHHEALATDQRVVFYCASGWRSALAAATAMDMGMADVAHVGGGFTAWQEADGPIEDVSPRR